MASVTVLKTIQNHIKTEVADNIKLQSPSDENDMGYELTNPSVHIGWVPPEGIIHDGAKVPCIVVGMDTAKVSGDEKDYTIRISVVIYSPGTHDNRSGEMIFQPTYDGYIDLLNVIDKTINSLRCSPTIENIKIDDEITWGMYQEQPYPYWYGYITLNAKVDIPSRFSNLV